MTPRTYTGKIPKMYKVVRSRDHKELRSVAMMLKSGFSSLALSLKRLGLGLGLNRVLLTVEGDDTSEIREGLDKMLAILQRRWAVAR